VELTILSDVGRREEIIYLTYCPHFKQGENMRVKVKQNADTIHSTIMFTPQMCVYLGKWIDVELTPFGTYFQDLSIHGGWVYDKNWLEFEEEDKAYLKILEDL